VAAGSFVTKEMLFNEMYQPAPTYSPHLIGLIHPKINLFI